MNKATRRWQKPSTRISSTLVAVVLGSSVVAVAAIAQEATWDTAALGCSNTDRVINEYVDNGGTAFTEVSLGGGTLSRWATDARGHRSQFVAQLHEGITRVWWQLCHKGPDSEMNDADIVDLETVYAWLRESIEPDVPIFISALNQYESDMPRWAGAVRTAAIAEYALNESGLDVQPGPVMPTLGWSEVVADGVHPNALGLAMLVPVLVDFFDSPPTTTTLPGTTTTTLPGTTTTTLPGTTTTTLPGTTTTTIDPRCEVPNPRPRCGD